MSKRIFIIPDTQCQPGQPIQHLRWVGQAIKRYKPDYLVHLGDHWDFPSLSTWSALGSKDKENARIYADIKIGNDGMDLLEEGMDGFKPQRKILLRGNHEQRLSRYVSSDPRLAGVLDWHLLNDTDNGWEVVPYFHGSPGHISLEGVTFAHYFANPMTSKPIAGSIQNRLNKIGTSFVQGHQQGLFQGNLQFATGRIQHGIVAGSCYLHDEEYKGMANAHWRGVVVLNEVRNGQFCEMPLTLDYLCREYEGMALSRYLQRNFKRAKERFTLANAA